MIELVALSQAKKHLRTDDDVGDGDLLLKIQSDSAASLSYIRGSRKLVVSGDRNLIEGESLRRVQDALLILFGYLDCSRDGEEEEKLQQGELPFSVTMLIYDPHRPIIF